MRKIRITFISGRGMPGHENLCFDSHYMEFDSLQFSFADCCKIIMEHGFRLDRNFVDEIIAYHVPPSAIIAILEVRH